MTNKFHLSIALISFISAAGSLSATQVLDLNEGGERKTRLEYLKDTYKFEDTGTVIGLGSDAKGNFLVFDQTIFYPQGGGQPSDVGKLIIDAIPYNVNFVSFNDGIVHHYIKDQVLDSALKGKSAKMEVNPDQRLLHAKSHTAGHLLGHIIEKIAPELTAAKGYHFLNGPYVEFEGALSSCSKEDLLIDGNKILKEKLASAQTIAAKEVEPEALKAFKLPSQFKVPAGKNTRVVQIQSFNPSPCGGTHIRSLAEMKEVIIKKIQVQANKNITKISYNFQ